MSMEFINFCLIASSVGKTHCNLLLYAITDRTVYNFFCSEEMALLDVLVLLWAGLFVAVDLISLASLRVDLFLLPA